MAPVARDQELELTIDSLAYGGNGVARLNGFVLFVRRGLPGDLVRARVTKVKRSHAEALATEVLVPLRDGKLALGTWQGIFFCEFDGPRERKVYVSALR